MKTLYQTLEAVVLHRHDREAMGLEPVALDNEAEFRTWLRVSLESDRPEIVFGDGFASHRWFYDELTVYLADHLERYLERMTLAEIWAALNVIFTRAKWGTEEHEQRLAEIRAAKAAGRRSSEASTQTETAP